MGNTEKCCSTYWKQTDTGCRTPELLNFLRRPPQRKESFHGGSFLRLGSLGSSLRPTLTLLNPFYLRSVTEAGTEETKSLFFTRVRSQSHNRIATPGKFSCLDSPIPRHVLGSLTKTPLNKSRTCLSWLMISAHIDILPIKLKSCLQFHKIVFFPPL